MIEQGRVVNVVEYDSGGELAEDAAAGTNVLLVEDSFDFEESGGTLELNGVELAYTLVDAEDDLITLAAPLAVAASMGDWVYKVPKGRSKRAQIDTEDGTEGHWASIKGSDFDIWDTGIRDPEEQESVTISDESGNWVIEDADDEVPHRDLSEADTSTLPPPPPAPPPAVSPVPDAFAGSGSVVVRWDRVEGATHYSLYTTTDTTDPKDDTTLYLGNATSPMFIYDLPMNTDHHFAVQSHGADPLQDPAPSDWSVPAQVGPIDEEVLSASVAIIKAVIAEQVEAVGLEIAGGQSWNGITGFTIPGVVNYPPNNTLDAYVWAKLIARSLTIENFLKIQGKTNEVSVGAEVVIADAVSTPDTSPAQESWWEEVTQFSIAEGAADLRGIVREDAATNTWVSCLINLGTAGNDCQLVRFVDGVEVARSPVLTNTDGYGGFCRHPTTGDYYVCNNPSWYSNPADGGANAESFWNVEHVSADLTTKLGFGQPVSRQVGFSSPGIRFTSDDTQIYPYSSSKVMIAGRVGGSVDRLHGLTFDWSDMDAFSNRADGISITLSDRLPPNESFQGLTKGKPPGNDQLGSASLMAGYWTAWYSGVDPFLNISGIPAVPRAYGNSVRGAWHDGTYHYTLNSAGKVFRYEKALLTGQVGYTFRDTVGTQHETGVSPPKTISVSRGAGVKVTPNPPPYTGDPESPDVSQVFARVGSGDPWRDHGPATPTKEIGVIDGAAPVHGTIQSFAGAGITPGRVRSAASDGPGQYLIDLFGNGDAPRIKNLRHTVPHFRGYRSSATAAISPSTWERVNFNFEQSWYAITLTNSNGTWTIQKAGLYNIKAQVRWANLNGTRRHIGIYKNGVMVTEVGVASAALTTTAAGHQIADDLDLAVGDVIEIKVWHNHTAAVDITGGLETDTKAYIRYVGDKA